jgi:hypothetical protein
MSRIVLAALLALAWLPSDALARSTSDFRYPFTRVWTTAVRLLRVDLNCPIEEKDRNDGYFLFQYSYHGKAVPGSVELIRTVNDGAEGVRVVVQIAAMPVYVERVILTRLERKLRKEIGEPRTKTPSRSRETPSGSKGEGDSREKAKPAEPEETKTAPSGK